MLTNCTRCGLSYDAASTEQTDAPDRLCRACACPEQVACRNCGGEGYVMRWVDGSDYEPRRWMRATCLGHLCQGGQVPAFLGAPC